MNDFDPTRRAALIGSGSALLSRSSLPYSPPVRPASTATVSVLDYIPQGLHGAIRRGSCQTDLTRYFQAATVAANDGKMVGAGPGGVVLVPAGTYPVSNIGIRDTIVRGEHRDSTRIAAIRGGGDRFLLDAMLDRDGVSKNTHGNGYAESLTIDAARTGASGLRTYGGGAAVRDVAIIDAAIGLSAGLPIWSSFSNIYCNGCDTGFHTFAMTSGDSGTSTTFLDCWANGSRQHGFHISQLMYSSFLNCVAQDSGKNGFYIEGDANGSVAAYSLQLIGCGNEGRGRPFYFRKCRDLTIIGARVVSPSPDVDHITFDDSAGSIRDFSTVGPTKPPFVSLRLINHGAPPGGVLIDGSIISIDPKFHSAFTVIGGGINNQTGVQAPSFTLSTSGIAASVQLESQAGGAAMTWRAGNTRLAAFPLQGGLIFSAPPSMDAMSMLGKDEVAVSVTSDRQGLRFLFRDANGRTRVAELAGRIVQ